MADQGMPAIGTILKRGNGASPEVFTQIAEVTDVNGPDLKLDTIEVTHLSNIWKERKATYLDPGSVKMTINWIPANATQSFVSGILLDMVNRTLRNWQLLWPDGIPTTWTFAAFVVDFQPKEPLAGKSTAEITLQLSGQPTLA